MTPCGSVLGKSTRAKRFGRGARTGAATGRANSREDEVDPGEPLKPSFVIP